METEGQEGSSWNAAGLFALAESLGGVESSIEHPAPPSLRMDGRFRAMSTMSVGQPQGGQLMTAAWSTLSLSSDGRFEKGRGIGSAGPNISAHGILPSQHGQYHIDGYSIELRFADGTVERTGFFIVAGRDYDGQQPDVFGIGNTVFTRSRSTRR